MTTEEIAIAYDRLAEKRRALCAAAIIEATAKFNLDAQEAAALLDGRITSKNPEKRKAMATRMFAEERKNLLAAEQDSRITQMDYDIAEAKVKSLELQLRRMEWAK